VVSWSHSELGELLSSAKPDQLSLVGVQLSSVHTVPPKSYSSVIIIIIVVHG